LIQSPSPNRGQTSPERALVRSIAAGATPARASARLKGLKARAATLMKRKGEPQRNDWGASAAYAAMNALGVQRRRAKTDRLADVNENAIVNACAAKLPSVRLTSNQGVYDSEACEPIEVAIC
jgi:hypothetical protein